MSEVASLVYAAIILRSLDVSEKLCGSFGKLIIIRQGWVEIKPCVCMVRFQPHFVCEKRIGLDVLYR
jgi:hypothetical protein